MKILTYKEQLLDPRWQRKKSEILTRDNFRCNDCGSDEKTLHVHHKMYIRNCYAWEYKDDNFETLCKDCHAKRHNKHQEPVRNYINDDSYIKPQMTTTDFLVKFKELKKRHEERNSNPIPLTVDELKKAWAGFCSARKLAKSPAVMSLERAILEVDHDLHFIIYCQNTIEERFIHDERWLLIDHIATWFGKTSIGHSIKHIEQKPKSSPIGSLAKIRAQYLNQQRKSD